MAFASKSLNKNLRGLQLKSSSGSKAYSSSSMTSDRNSEQNWSKTYNLNRNYYTFLWSSISTNCISTNFVFFHLIFQLKEIFLKGVSFHLWCVEFRVSNRIFTFCDKCLKKRSSHRTITVIPFLNSMDFPKYQDTSVSLLVLLWMVFLVGETLRVDWLDSLHLACFIFVLACLYNFKWVAASSTNCCVK